MWDNQRKKAKGKERERDESRLVKDGIRAQNSEFHSICTQRERKRDRLSFLHSEEEDPNESKLTFQPKKEIRQRQQEQHRWQLQCGVEVSECEEVGEVKYRSFWVAEGTLSP
jgi:hypothetical protein